MIASEKMPGWMRAAEIFLGIVSLIAAIYVLAYPGTAVLTLILLLATGLIFLGARDIALGAAGSFLPTWLRAANIILGVLAFILSVIVIAEPGFATLTLILLLYIGLSFRGIAGIAMGAAAKQFPSTFRSLSIATGVVSLILAIIFLAVPSLAVATLIILLSIGLLITGIEYVVDGAIGRKLVLVAPKV